MIAKDAVMAVREKLRSKKNKNKKLCLDRLGELISRKLAVLRANPWFQFLMFVRSEVAVLASQFLVFANPSPDYPLTIIVPLFMGALIAVQAIAAPVP